MSETFKDTLRSLNAAKDIIDGRDVNTDRSAILVTTEHAVAAILLTLMGTPRLAVGMLNEGLLQGVEERIAMYAAKEEK